VLTSIEYERMLSASGPTGGHVVRPSDKRAPSRIAILQCVGSRDTRSGNEHCSAVCCMQAAKDAIITQEHLPEAKSTIFYMDVRAYGKGFDRFIDKAKNAHHTRFICGRIASVESDPATNNLRIAYITEEGRTATEEFDMLVLSVGLQPSGDAMTTARHLGVGLDSRGFVDVRTLSPVDTGRAGVFACGSVSGPKDIPESVMEASGAASAAAAMVGALERKDIRVKQRAERDLRREPVRVGVFVCRCGINIAATVDVPALVKYAATLPGVKHAGELLFTCAQDSQQVIRAAIEEKKLNRVVVSACTPRTHEPLFQKTLAEAGLNPYMFEFANIREHCSWVHQKEPAKATEKAKDLVRAAVAKVALAEPLYRSELGVDKNALVIGGGLAGMTAALDLAEQGFGVHLVEKEAALGGNLRHVHTTLSGEETAGTLAALIARVTSHPHISIHLNAPIKAITGYVGNFKTTLPPAETQSKLGKGADIEIAHGTVIVATGASERRPEEYLYGQDDRIVTQRQFEDILKKGAKADPQIDLAKARSIVMIQCVGSRDDERPYCSRVCCSNALKNAIACKEKNPGVAVYVLFRDIRSYGLREKYYRKAREKGVIFVRYDAEHKPVVSRKGDKLTVSVEDKILGRTLTVKPDLLVLSTGITPNTDNKALSQFLKVPLGPDGFFLEAHVKLRPVDFATDGVFVCGLAHYPKDIGETISQARAAAGRAATILSKDKLLSEGKIASVREDRCSGCGVCVAVCPFKAVELDAIRNVAVVNAALCKGCGTCTASCLANAMDLCGFKNEQILEMLATL
jgi:heterodisulfide reductase subunit A